MSLYASSSHGRVGLLGAPEGGTNETLSWKVPVGRLPSTTAQTPAFAPLAPSVRQRRQQAINLLRACRAWLACRLPQPHPHNKTDKTGMTWGASRATLVARRGGDIVPHPRTGQVPSDVTSSPVVSVFGPAWPRAQLISVSPSRKRLDDDATPVEYADPRRATRQATSSFPASLVQHCCRRVKPKNRWMRKFFLRVQAGSVSAASNSGTHLTHLGSPHGTPGSHGESPASCPPSRLDKEVAVGSRVWGPAAVKSMAQGSPWANVWHDVGSCNPQALASRLPRRGRGGNEMGAWGRHADSRTDTHTAPGDFLFAQRGQRPHAWTDVEPAASPPRPVWVKTLAKLSEAGRHWVSTDTLQVSSGRAARGRDDHKDNAVRKLANPQGVIAWGDYPPCRDPKAFDLNCIRVVAEMRPCESSPSFQSSRARTSNWTRSKVLRYDHASLFAALDPTKDNGIKSELPQSFDLARAVGSFTCPVGPDLVRPGPHPATSTSLPHVTPYPVHRLIAALDPRLAGYLGGPPADEKRLGMVIDEPPARLVATDSPVAGEPSLVDDDMTPRDVRAWLQPPSMDSLAGGCQAGAALPRVRVSSDCIARFNSRLVTPFKRIAAHFQLAAHASQSCTAFHTLRTEYAQGIVQCVRTTTLRLERFDPVLPPGPAPVSRTAEAAALVTQHGHFPTPFASVSRPPDAPRLTPRQMSSSNGQADPAEPLWPAAHSPTGPCIKLI
ncbi:hypothetical protein PCL_13107 [Purpureocillium lilacinum]|uniref:Uncharacterized protein n=1 Tax=Purpureocillium lilacinum TaxID=33203 RepID=A0A2U3E856_PURLI|nr:hypothetical protein PCL_13107 [Purpureocillium lilacinum]